MSARRVNGHSVKEREKDGIKSALKSAPQESILSTIKAQLRPALAGLQDGICFQRCIVYTVHNHQILVKLGHCVGLNGGIYLGSMVIWSYIVCPISNWILRLAVVKNNISQDSGPIQDASFVRLSRLVLTSVFAMTWLLPVYFITFPLSCMWYQQIAELAHNTDTRKDGSFVAKPKGKEEQEDVFYQIAQELYRVVLFGVFFLQTSLAAFLPIVGLPLGFVLLSWLNALYSFDYKWSLSRRPLEERVHFFEQHWGFFAGFGSIGTLLSYAWSWWSQRLGIFWPLASDAAFLAMIYPLFILISSDADPEAAYNARTSAVGKTKTRSSSASQLPIFQTSITITTWIISLSPDVLQWPQTLWRYRWRVVLAAVAVCLAPALLGYGS